MNNLHETTELAEALEALPSVNAVSYEFPGFWVIKTTNGQIYYLGDINGPWGWNDVDGDMSGDTLATSANEIAKDFGEWLELIKNY